jgi:serine/threonine protein kinase/tetratricopeptide (TPR) repeat protein
MAPKEQESSGGPAQPQPLAAEPSVPPEDPPTTQAVEEYRALLRAGCKPDREEFLARHPEAAAILSECLDALEFIQAAAPDLPAGAANPAAAVEPQAPLGDFRLLRELGRGGMGVVYEAVQVSLGRRVALKVLPFATALEPRQLQRFKTEAQAAARLHHTNIVPVHAVGCERGTHFYAMQFIDGQTLAAVIADLRRSAGLEVPAEVVPGGDGREMSPASASPPPRQVIHARKNDAPAFHPPGAVAEPPTRPAAALSTERSVRSPEFFRTATRLGLQAAEALDYAHRQEVIHRDIKPANLLVDGEGNLWITDFGLARLQGEAGLTVTGDLVGTLRYMSPEQALGQRTLVDHRTDIYSLGATLYELLTLEPAVPGSERLEVLRRIEREEPRRPRRLNPAVPPELQTIVGKAMAKHPAARYGTAQELADDLRRFLEDKPIRARRPTFGQVTAKWARRHRGIVVTATVAVLLGLVLGIAGLVIGYLRIRQEKTQAEADRQRADRNQALAMDALNRIYLRVAEQRFARDPHPRPEDRELLALALGFYQKLARENDHDPAVRQAVAEAYFRVGDIQKILGQPGPAKQAYERGLALREQRVAESPSDYGGRAALAAGYRSLANVLEKLGDRRAAVLHYRQALDLWVQLGTDFPEAPEARQMVASSHTDLGMFLAEDGAWAAAENHHRQAMTLRAQLATDYPTDLGHREGLGYSHWQLGNVMAATGRGAEAETHYRQALEIQARLVVDHPDVPHYRQQEALSACNLALLLAGRNADAARTYYQRALDLRGRLAAEFPAIPEYRHELAEVEDKLGILLAEERKPVDAGQHFRRALELRSRLAAECPDVRYRQGLATVHGDLGALLLTKEPVTAQKHLGQALDLLDGLEAAASSLPKRRGALANVYHNLGCLGDHTGDWAAAEGHYRRAVDLWTRLAEEEPARPDYRNHLAIDHHRLGNLLHAKGEREEVGAHFRRAAALWEQLTAAPLTGAPNDRERAEVLDHLALLLANCPDLRRRDPDRSVRLAREAIARAPRHEKYWSTLGLAYYRARDPWAALGALRQARRLTGSQDVADAFLLAMVHWRLGDKVKARHRYDEAAQFMKSEALGGEQLRRVRAEAAAQLGIDAPPVRTDDAP